MQEHTSGQMWKQVQDDDVARGRINKQKRAAFTLAEVLITLGIIGVVAALTLPTLMSNYRKQVVETRLSKFYSSMNQLIMLSEVDNGPKEFWEEQPKETYDVDEDGNQDRTQESKMVPWFNKYIKPYINALDATVDPNLYVGRVLVKFPDGSAAIIGNQSWYFFPEAKDYKTSLDTNNKVIVDQSQVGTKVFTFFFKPNDKISTYKYHYKKGVEPYKCGWNGKREMLLNEDSVGCKEHVTNERAYCTALIQMNGWKIPKDYPLKF